MRMLQLLPPPRRTDSEQTCSQIEVEEVGVVKRHTVGLQRLVGVVAELKRPRKPQPQRQPLMTGGNLRPQRQVLERGQYC